MVHIKCWDFLAFRGLVGFCRRNLLMTLNQHVRVQIVRRHKAIPAELAAVPSCCRISTSVPSVNIPVSRPLCSFSQHSPLQYALLSSVNIPLSSPLCSSSQHSALQSALFLQSTFRSPVRPVPSVNIPLSSPLCSFSHHSALQSARFFQ